MRLRFDPNNPFRPGSITINWILLIALVGIGCYSIVVDADNQPIKKEQALESLEKRSGGQYAVHLQSHERNEVTKHPKLKSYFKSLTSSRGRRHRKSHRSRKGHHHHKHGKKIKKKAKDTNNRHSKDGHHHHGKHKGHKDKHKARKHKHGSHGKHKIHKYEKCKHHDHHNHGKDHPHHHNGNNGNNNNQECIDGSLDKDKDKSASLGILVCNNKTISATYCPKGTEPYPERNLKGGSGLGTGRSLAYLDVITMNPPCPKPIRNDIDNAYNQLTCQDREVVEKYFKFGGATAASMRADSNIMSAQCNGGYWDDKCTAVGYFCGSSIFGCKLIDDGIYFCGAIGDKPKFVEMCEFGGCVEHTKTKGKATCADPKCLCSDSGQICGSTFPDKCKLDPNSLYFCKEDGSHPIHIGECHSGVCPKGSTQCSHPNCECKIDGEVCGSIFPSDCGLNSNAIYNCKEGSNPSISKDCDPLSCKDGKCTEPTPLPCRCDVDGMICGATFIESCNYNPDWIYMCTKGEDPIPNYQCESGSCEPSSSSCDKDKCLCSATQSAVCGSDFPSKCDLEKDSIYICTGDNTKPSFYEKCELGCQKGTGRCVPGPCDCTEHGRICGSTFPKSCNLTSSSLYNCHVTGAHPIIDTECPSGECLSGSSSCTPSRCTCTILGDTCGSNFPIDCDYDPNSLYTCSAIGQPGTLVEKCLSDECPKDSSNCSPDKCACDSEDVGHTCGSNFPKECELEDQMVYNCYSEGRRPIPEKLCLVGDCAAGGGNCTIDPCQCQEKGQFCGTQFPDHCGYAPGGHYTCKIVGSHPDFDFECSSGKCDPLMHGCVPGPCDCTSEGIVCGSTFPDSCNLNDGILYLCETIGRPPKISSSCSSGSCSSDGHTCDPDLCVCKADELICGSNFPGECGLDPNILYDCASSGSDPVKNKDCPSGHCDTQSNDCTPIDECSCSANGNICGGDFPPTCKYDSTAQYMCKTGKKPELIHKCLPGTCITDGDICPENHPDCLCNSTGTICGSGFPSKCQLDKDSLYTCPGKDASPIDGVHCPSGSCPLGSDKCTDPKNCKCTATGLICGSSFDVSCGYTREALYECKAIGDDPAYSQTCDSKQCISGTSECYEIGDCECSKTGLTCGSNFPEECHYFLEALYYCKEEGGLPTIVEQCASGLCDKGNSSCSTKECLCPSSGQLCGSSFSSDCKLEQNSLYFCQHTGSEPEFIRNCISGTCLPDQNACLPEPSICKCEAPGQICGSTFDPSCNLKPDTLYYCPSENGRPQEITQCNAGQCKPGNSNCEPDANCTCPEAGLLCGSRFPPQCGFAPNNHYLCVKQGDNPQDTNDETKLRSPSDPECTDIPDNLDKCKCSKDGLYCGFNLKLDECTDYSYNPNSIYSCNNGEYPVEQSVCVDPFECTQNSDGAICVTDPCLCTVEGATICGRENATCGYKVGSSYVCNGGEWKLSEDCDNGCKVFAGVCYDKCDCKSSGLVCGGAFPDCGLKDGTLYMCEDGKLPSDVTDCSSGLCPFNPDEIYNGKCTPDPCYCTPDQTTVCSNDFPETCQYHNNTVLSCPSGGGEPTEVQQCSIECITEDSMSQCKKDPCACTDHGSFCGSTFPKECHFPPDSVRSCPGKDTPSVPAGTCDPFECYNNGTVATCKPDPCACTEAGKTYCDSDFPLSCGYTPQSVYSCTTIGKRPDPVENCAPEKCTSADGVGKCDKNQCTCNEIADRICGNTFPDVCGYDPAAVYSCDNVNSKPSIVEQCRTGLLCANSAGNVTCDSQLCHCKDTDVGKNVCSGSLDKVCNFDPNVLLTCVQAGDIWKPVQDCAPGVCDDSGTPQCSFDDCKCSADEDGKDICGNNFPKHCNLDSNSLYICATGKLPSKVKDCGNDKCEFTPTTDSAACVPDKCICTADTTTTTCGNYWDTSCRLEGNTIYSCSGEGSKPAPINDCKPAECFGDSQGAKCKVDPCLCADSGTYCGHNFLSSCNLSPEAIYQCSGSGSTPQLTVQCPGTCFHNFTTSVTQCINGPCDCPAITKPSDFCGATFPDSCNYDSNSLYHCENSGYPPTKSVNCEDTGAECITTGPDANTCKVNPCTCSDGKSQKCGSEFPASCGFSSSAVYSCSNPKVPSLIEPCGYKCEPDPTGHCVENPCVCRPGVDVMCGSEFPQKCNFKPDMVYSCNDPANPTPGSDCSPNKCITTPSAHCYVDPCDCKPGDTTVCGSSFPSQCLLDKQAIYQCQNGKPTFSNQCKGHDTCVIESGSAICEKNPECLCKEGQITVCATSYPPYCGNTEDPKRILKCNGAGSVPEKSVLCDLGCEVNVPGVSAKCKVSPCACTSDMAGNMVCPSQFPSDCGYDMGKIYMCGNANTLPTVAGDCKAPSVCTPTSIKGTTSGSCVTPISCKCPPGTPTICGSSFDKSCGFESETVYNCNNNLDPSKVTSCLPRKCVPAATSASCEPDPCICTDNGPFCGSELNCPGLDKNTYYSCAKGQLPFAFGSCKSGNPTDDRCLCNDQYPMCSTYFPFECGYDQNQAMTCAGRGAKPQVAQQCGVGRCVNAKCDTNCKCTSSTVICGKQFDQRCGYEPGTLYTCIGAGTTPVAGKKCVRADICSAISGIGICLGECECKDVDTVCGAAFPSLCKFDATSLYRCDYTGATPVSPRKCTIPCNPQNGPDKCGMAI